MKSEATSISSDGLLTTVGTLSLKLFDPTADFNALWDLLAEHREELTTNKELMKLNPHLESYDALQDSGRLLSIAVMDGSNIVGYSINYICPNLHYSDVQMCQNDVLFVKADYRNSVGLHLIQWTERLATERGCHLMLWHAKPNTALDVILRRKKYRTQDIIYSKEL